MNNVIVVEKEWVELPIYEGRGAKNRKMIGSVKIDKEDASLFDDRILYLDQDGYPTYKERYDRYKVHRLVMRASTDQFIDHIFHDKLDARKSQLRFADRQTNSCNRKLPKNNTSGYRGLVQNKDGTWRGIVRFHKQTYTTKRYLCKHDAGIAISNLRTQLGIPTKGILSPIIAIEHKSIPSRKRIKSISI